MLPCQGATKQVVDKSGEEKALKARKRDALQEKVAHAFHRAYQELQQLRQECLTQRVCAVHFMLETMLTMRIYKQGI